MIQIAKVACMLQDFLNTANVDKFKIFVRINYTLDVVVVPSNEDLRRNFMDEFYLTVDDKDILTDIKLKFKVISIEDSEEPFNSNLFVGGYNCIDWGPRYRFDSLLQKHRGTKGQLKIPVVTFYSYKGGMGRTTTMVAAAMDLAINKEKRVAIIDCDLEAPGYLNFFDLSNHIGLKEGHTNGLVEFIADSQFSTNPELIDINNYMINVGLGNDNKASFENLDNIWLVPAGNLNEGYLDVNNISDRSNYLEGLSRINLSKISSVVDSFKLLFSKIQEAVEPDIIFIDSRTGFNDIFGTAAFYLSSCVIGFFGFNRQTQPGLMNLLEEYYKEQNNFKLNLVFSILPIKADDQWIANHKSKIEEYISSLEVPGKDHPSYLYLHRNEILEKIGTDDERSDEAFIDLVRKKKFDDYSALFEKIDSLFPQKKESHVALTSEMPALQLRNIVLKQLKVALKNVKNFAEDTTIVEQQFFYRECMKDLFNPDKFMIQGYKGTGKTYLYRALADKNISTKIQEWAGVPTGKTQESIFINILPKIENDPDDKGYPFESIQYSKIEESEYYFNCFWQIYTWNKIILHPDFSSIRESSELSNYIEVIAGQKSVKRFNELIDKGVDTLIVIEDDLNKINDYLIHNNKRLFVLYDRLDTCINPLRWNKAVSPLINFWRDNNATFSHIMPKIFVRTDLFRQIEGTNKMRLVDNIISIEWSIGEVFGYFFKQIFSDPRAAEAYWAIAKKVGIKDAFIQNTKISFTKVPINQFKSLSQAEMQPLIQIFFGKEVRVGYVTLNSPWDYFSKEFANADNSAISLRPFINTMSGNAIDRALAKTEPYIHEIMSSEIYASKDVREKTTETYFDDLTQDAFSHDLQQLREVIKSAEGDKYRYKSLKEDLFNDLLKVTFEKIEDSDVIRSTEDLRRMIEANGIMARKATSKGIYYRFAPIYHYTWALANSDLEKEDKKYKKTESNTPSAKSVPETKSNRKVGLLHMVKYSNPYITIEGSRFKYEARGLDKTFMDGDQVSFVIGSEDRPTQWNPNAKFSYAYDIQLAD